MASRRCAASATDNLGCMDADKVVVVIGAGPGVGLAVARRFGKAGHRAVLLGRDQAEVDELVGQLADEGITAAGGPIDLMDPGDVRRAVDQAGRGTEGSMCSTSTRAGGVTRMCWS